jgi:ring-1,2-phenylacetyl-CoA epoxidase subunit PaaD
MVGDDAMTDAHLQPGGTSGLEGRPHADIWALLDQVPDPEIPVISIVELGIVRDVAADGETTEVQITPTYSGCPAMFMIEGQIRETLGAHGYPNPKVRTVLSPAWTTDWLTDGAKEKLRAYGIAPPPKTSASKRALRGLDTTVHCPRCGSENTGWISPFGSTPCKALYRCNDCQEPFDYFKCH